jgi:hypothetical protein
MRTRPLRLPLLGLVALAASGCFGGLAKGPRFVTNPRVTTDRSVDCSSIDTIRRSLISPEMTDEQKVLAIFHWTRRVLYHGDGAMKEYAWHLPYLINVFGHGSGLRQTTLMAVLCDRLGFRSRNWTRHGHHLIEVEYDGAWHCFDPHRSFYVLDRSEPPVIASVEQLQNDPSLALKAAAEGRAAPGFLLCGDKAETFAGKDGWTNHGQFPGSFPKPVLGDEPFGAITLRRGEKYIRTWMPGEHWFRANSWMDHSGPYHTCRAKDRKDTINWPLFEPHAWTVGTSPVYRHWGAGRIVYTPDLTDRHLDDAIVVKENVGLHRRGRVLWLVPEAPDLPASVVFGVDCPYVITAADLSLKIEGTGEIEAAVSTDRGRTWKPVPLAADNRRRTGATVEAVNGSFGGYWLRLRPTGYVGLRRMKLVTHFQLNPYSLPYLVPGRNEIFVRAEKMEGRLTVQYIWAEGEGWTQERRQSGTFARDGSFVIDVAGPKWPRMKALVLSVKP